MTPTIPLQTTSTVTPLSLYTISAPCPPPKKWIVHYWRLACSGHYRLPSLKRYRTMYFFEKINRCVTYRKNPWILLDSVAPQGATLSKKSCLNNSINKNILNRTQKSPLSKLQLPNSLQFQHHTATMIITALHSSPQI